MSDRPKFRVKSSRHHASRVSRRHVLSAGLSMAVAGALPARAQPQRSQPVQFGLTPVFLTSDLELLTNLAAYLSAASNRDVQLVTRRTYQEITTLLLTGQLDAAWICGYPFIQYREQLDVLAVPVWQGKPLYSSYVIVEASRTTGRFDDLAGDIHAFSDPDSNSGYLVTRSLLAEKGSSPEAFFRQSFFTYGHRNVVRAVAAGLAQSGSVDGYVWEVLQDVEPELTGKTRIVRRSELLGFPPIATRKGRVNSRTSSELAQAFLRMSNDEGGRRVLSALRLDGFTAGDPALYNSIADKVEDIRRRG